MSRRAICIAALVAAAIVVALAIGISRELRGIDITMTIADAHVIASTVGHEYHVKRSVTQADIDDIILHLHNASVTSGGVDANGKPADLFGTPFKVGATVAGLRVSATVTSAGPDRRFGTDDDIEWTDEGH